MQAAKKIEGSNVLRVRFKRRMFNPLFFHLRRFLKDNSIRNICIIGGSSAGKTHTVIQSISLDGYQRKYNSIVFRKEQASIKDTIKMDFVEIVEDIMNHPALDGMFKVTDFRVDMDTGNFIRLRGLDKPDKIKGLKGYRKLFLDECDQFTLKDWNEAQRRLRGKDNQQIITSMNPVDEKHWFKTEVIDTDIWKDLPTSIEGNPYADLSEDSYIRINESGDTILIKTNHKDNKWIVGGEVQEKKGAKIIDISYGRVDQQVLNTFEKMKKRNPNDYLVYALGEWGRLANENPFFWYIRDEAKVRSIPVWKDEPILFSFDFNIDSCACTVSQIKRTVGQRFLGGHVVYGGTRELCNLLVSKEMGYFPHTNRVFVTGDPSGKSGSAIAGINAAGEKINSFMIIQEVFNTVAHVPDDHMLPFDRKLLNHEASRDHCNEIFYSIPMWFDERYCEELWKELFKAKPKPRGTSGEMELYKNRSDGYAMDLVDSFRYNQACTFQNKEMIDKVANTIKMNSPEVYKYFQACVYALKPKSVDELLIRA